MVSIPFDQGDVFRPLSALNTIPSGVSQSLSIRAMSFDTVNTTDSDWGKASQSLSIRAMSFDSKFAVTGFGYQVSIPFDQGDVFRRYYVV